MQEEIQPQPTSKSTRSFEEWKASLTRMVEARYGDPAGKNKLADEWIKPYYDQGLMPTVAFNELFNR